jgi:glycosyltransferase involved in cell wall biosynthesis
MSGIRVLATAHGWSGFSLREQRLYYPGDKRLLASLPRVITVSSRIREELVRYGASPDRVSVVLNGIDHVAFRRDRPSEAAARAKFDLRAGDFVLGAIGRLEIEKRYDLLIAAFARLHKRYPHTRLLLAGEGSLRNALTAQATQAGVAAACRFAGFTSDVVSVHHALDTCVQTSDTEGTPNSVLEAMAMETPIVATDAGGTGELVRQGVHGLLVPIGDVNALEQALESVITDRQAATQRADAARLRVEHELSFIARMQAVERIYDELMVREGPQVAA